MLDRSEVNGGRGRLARFLWGRADEKEAEIAMEHRNKNKSVLVVANNRELQYMLSLRLISAGYTVYGAENAVEALELMEKHPVDLVLTDYCMPTMDGLEFLSVSRMRWPEVPVVILSGERDSHMVQEAVDRGAFAWVRKGAETTTLMQVVALAIPQSVHV